MTATGAPRRLGPFFGAERADAAEEERVWRRLEAPSSPWPPPFAPAPPVEPLPAPFAPPAEARASGPWRASAYLGLFVVLAGPLWGAAFAYARLTPKTYESKFSLILPGDGVRTGLTLSEVGEAKASPSSPFASKDVTPKATYQEIALSPAVRAAAAERAGVSYQAFGAPRVRQTPQTAILEMRMAAASPEEAKRRAEAFLKAFEERVDNLRADELKRREASASAALEGYRSALATTRSQLLERQRQGEFVSSEQLVDIAGRLEARRAEMEALEGDIRGLEDESKTLSRLTSLDAAAAARALALKGDQGFQTAARALRESRQKLEDLRAVYGERHPEVAAERGRMEARALAASARAQAVIGWRPPDLERLTDIALSPEQGEILAALLKNDARLAGLKARLAAARESVSAARARLSALADEAAALEEASRGHQIAQAVFASALAKLDLARSDAYASYPLFQILDAPHAPAGPVSPKASAAYAGAAAGSLFILLGEAALWSRARRRPAASRKRSSAAPLA